MNFVVGIDPSLTGTGVIVLDENGRHQNIRLQSRSRGGSVRERNERYLTIVSRVIEFIEDCIGEENEPVVIAIEGYSFESEGRGRYLAEFGGLLRSDLCVFESSRIYEVAPATLKKYATEKKNRKGKQPTKTEVVHEVGQRWGCFFSSDDEYDAYILARLAGCIAGLFQPETERQAECETTLSHPYEMDFAQSVIDNAIFEPCWKVAWAYWALCWVGRKGKGGTKTVGTGNASIRRSGAGGNNASRIMSAAGDLTAWSNEIQRCEFEAGCFRDTLPKGRDTKSNGYYIDAPWVTAGKSYLHSFTETDHRDLKAELERFQNATVVIRYDYHELIRELYSDPRWQWTLRESRTQAGGGATCNEVMIVFKPNH